MNLIFLDEIPSVEESEELWRAIELAAELDQLKLDMTDGGFDWTPEELHEAARTAREWLFPDVKEAAA